MATATEVKAPQTAAFTDASFDVAPGDSVSLHTDEATGIWPGEFVQFFYDSAGVDKLAFELTGACKPQGISAYAKLIGKKAATVAKIGITKTSS